MAKFIVEKVIRQQSEIELEPSEVMTLQEAANFFGPKQINVKTISGYLDSGRLTTVIDPRAPNPRKGRRLVLRSEIEEWAARRGKRFSEATSNTLGSEEEV